MSKRSVGRRFLQLAIALECAFAGYAPSARAQEHSEGVLLTVQLVSESGEPLAGASIVVSRRTELRREGWTLVARQDVEGRAVEVDLPGVGWYRIVASARGHEDRLDTLEVRRSTDVRLVLPLDPYRLPAIVAGGVGAPPTPSVRTLDRVQFGEENLAYATVAEWLADVPGVSVSRGAGGRQYLSVRGSRPEDVLVLLDGVPLNDPLTGRADLTNLPTATLESATLVRGAASRSYGSGATAGALLLTSRTAGDAGVGGGVRLESFGGRGVDAQAESGGRTARFGASMSVDQADNDFPYRDPRDSEPDSHLRSNADARGAHVTLSGATGPMQASFRFDDSENGLPGRTGTSLFDSARAESRSWIASAGITGARGRTSISYARRRLGYRSSASAEPSSQEVRELRLSGDVEVPRTPLVLGGRLSSTHVAGDGLAGPRGRVSGGATAAAVIPVGPVQIDPGLSVDTDGGHAVLSPEVGVTWQVAASARLWGRLGRGFRAPTFGDLYFQSLHRLRANPELLPERIVLDAEMGFSGTLRFGAVTGTAAMTGWMRSTENPIVWVPSSVAVWSPRNLGSLYAKGLEVRLGFEGGDVAGGWGFRAGLSGALQHSRVGFGSNRNPLPYQPTSVAQLSLGAWRGGSGVTVSLRHTGRRTTSLAATRTLDAFLTADVSLSQNLSTGPLQLGLYGKVENLWNQDYELTELFPEPGRSFSLRIEARSSHR